MKRWVVNQVSGQAESSGHRPWEKTRGNCFKPQTLESGESFVGVGHSVGSLLRAGRKRPNGFEVPAAYCWGEHRHETSDDRQQLRVHRYYFRVRKLSKYGRATDARWTSSMFRTCRNGLVRYVDLPYYGFSYIDSNATEEGRVRRIRGNDWRRTRGESTRTNQHQRHRP